VTASDRSGAGQTVRGFRKKWFYLKRKQDSRGCDIEHGALWIIHPREAELLHEDSPFAGAIPGAPCDAISRCFYKYRLTFKVSPGGTSVNFQADSPESYGPDAPYWNRAPSCEERGFLAPFSGVLTKVSDDLIRMSLPHGSEVKLSIEGDQIMLDGK
jgi:hypothetical protein